MNRFNPHLNAVEKTWKDFRGEGERRDEVLSIDTFRGYKTEVTAVNEKASAKKYGKRREILRDTQGG